MARATKIDQFDVAEYLARVIYRAKGRVLPDPSRPRYGLKYEQRELQIMERWGQEGFSFEQIVAKLERDRLGVAMKMIDLGVGS